MQICDECMWYVRYKQINNLSKCQRIKIVQKRVDFEGARHVGQGEMGGKFLRNFLKKERFSLKFFKNVLNIVVLFSINSNVSKLSNLWTFC